MLSMISTLSESLSRLISCFYLCLLSSELLLEASLELEDDLELLDDIFLFFCLYLLLELELSDEEDDSSLLIIYGAMSSGRVCVLLALFNSYWFDSAFMEDYSSSSLTLF